LIKAYVLNLLSANAQNFKEPEASTWRYEMTCQQIGYLAHELKYFSLCTKNSYPRPV